MTDTIETVVIQENEAEIDEAVYLYSVQLQVQTREFKGQTSGTTKCALQINCNSAKEFQSQLWLKIHDKLKREVVFDDNEPRWNENVVPKEDDMGRFILFYDCKSKRSSTLNKINEITLNHWQSKEIWLYIHIYSLSVASLTLWKKVLKSLIEPINRDRAGATAVSDTNVLVAKLKEVHKFHYQSNHINWLMWSNRIQASEPHLRETLIQNPPPADMLHLFAVTKTTADDTLAEVRQNLRVAEDVNEGMNTGLARIRILFDNVVQQVQIDLLNHEIRAMEIQTTTTRSLINSMEQAVPAVVTQFGRQAFSLITDQEDVDHMQI